MKEKIKDVSFTTNVAERITLNSVLSSRVYLGDSKKFAKNLSEISYENDFAVGIDTNASFNEQYTEALNAELFNYFNPISVVELLEASGHPDLQFNKFLTCENPDNNNEMYYISEKYVIKYSEGIFKISPNNNEEIIFFVEDNIKKLDGIYSTYKNVPKNIITQIQKLEPRFSFGLFTSIEYLKSNDSTKKEQAFTFHIAFRGTEPNIKEFSKTDTNKNEFLKYFLEDYPNMSNHYEVIRPFVEQAIKLSKLSNISNMEITGHSLGGSMVDVFLETNKNNPDLEGVKYQGYAFGNPFGISTRNKIENFFECSAGKKIKETVESILNVNSENVVNEVRKKVRHIGKNFLNIGINSGITVGCSLLKIENNDLTHNYIKQMAVTWGIEPILLVSNLGIRLICNFCKIAKQTFSVEMIIDENFKKIEDNPKSLLISVQHSGDPVPTGGAFLYQHKGTRYLVSDKNEVFNKNNGSTNLKENIFSFVGNTIENFTGYSIHNHKAYNYVSSCVQRVDFTSDTALAQAIRNVNHTFTSVTPEFKTDNDCRNIFKNIKNLRHKAYPVLHSIDKQILA